jgi:hypothetical protein
MHFDVKFNLTEQSFTPSFGEVHNISDGGFERGYDAGYKKGNTEGQEVGYNKGHAEGEKAEYDRFWDAYQDYGNRSEYGMLFAGYGWTKETFKPKYLIRPGSTGNHYMMFARTGIEVIDETIIDTSQVTAFAMSFYNSSILKSATIDIRNLKEFKDAFNFDSVLETVMLKNVPETCNFVGGFDGCRKLTNFTVTGIIGGTNLKLHDSAGLTEESVQNIIDHLKDRTGLPAVTLTFHATVGGKLTAAQKAEITAKNWTLVY